MVFNRESESAFELALRALPALKAEFGPEEKARKIVFQLLAERKIIVCSQCSYENKIPSSEFRMFRCCKCRKEVWVTARTQFHKARLFFVRLAILRLHEMGICINPNQAAVLLRASYAAVSNIYKQLGITVSSRIPESACEVLTESAIPIVSRRTRFTPAEKAPFQEEFEMQQKLKDETSSAISSTHTEQGFPEMSELEVLILELIGRNSISFEELLSKTNAESRALSVSITLLELRGVLEARNGSFFKRSLSVHIQIPQFDDRQTHAIESFCSFIKDYFQGVGRKNLQIYSSFHWLAYDRKTWSKNSLRDLFIAHPYISYQEILEYVTPLAFKIVPRFNTS